MKRILFLLSLMAFSGLASAQFSQNISLSGLTPSATVVCSNSVPITVTVNNLDPVNPTTGSIIVDLFINGSLISSASPVLPMSGGSSQLLNLYTLTNKYGNFTITVIANYTNDTDPSNNMVTHSFSVQMGGNYTIGTGPSYDFQTLKSAVDTLNTYGICSPTVFNFATGHSETSANITLNTTTTDAVNTLTFNGNDATVLAAAGTSVTGDGIIKIAGTDYVTFDGFNLLENPANTSNNTKMEFGFALVKKNATSPFDGVHYATIKNCYIHLDHTNNNTRGIYVNNQTATSTSSLSIQNPSDASSYNKFYNNRISNAYFGIYVRGFNDTAPYGLYDMNNEIGVDGRNIIDSIGGGSQTAYGIYASYQQNLKIANDSINNYPFTQTSTLYGIFASIGYNSNIDIYNNIIELKSGAGTSSLTGINNSIGEDGTDNIVNIYNNTIKNIQYTTATSGIMYLITNLSDPDSLNIYNNTISNVTKTGSSHLYGIHALYISGSNGTEYIYNNTIEDISHNGTGNLYGIYSSSSGISKKNISNNSVKNLTGNNIVQGINANYGTSGIVKKNYISGLTCNSGTSSGYVHGFYIHSGVKVFLTNNFISALYAPLLSSTSGINGIYLNNPDSVRISYNTIYLDAQNSATDFGTNGIYSPNSNPKLELKNNIIVNNGAGATTALHIRNIPNIIPASNNNCYYSGTPGPTNLIYRDSLNNLQTISDYKLFIGPAENNSFSELPPFTNTTTAPYNLQMLTTIATFCESGGQKITSPIAITDDYYSDIRWGETGYTGTGTAPDVGAEEFEGIKMHTVNLGNDTIICANQSIVLNAGNPGAVFAWAPGGQNTQQITLDSTGLGLGAHNISVAVTANGKTVSDTILITFTSCTGMPDISKFIGLSIYPNPSAGLWNMNLEGYTGEVNIDIYNMNGVLFHSESLQADNSLLKQIDMSMAAKGLYMVYIQGERFFKKEKILIH